MASNGRTSPSGREYLGIDGDTNLQTSSQHPKDNSTSSYPQSSPTIPPRLSSVPPRTSRYQRQNSRGILTSQQRTIPYADNPFSRSLKSSDRLPQTYMTSNNLSSDDEAPIAQRVLSKPSQTARQKPLIDLVTNEWKNRRRSTSSSSGSEDDSYFLSRDDSDYDSWPPRLPAWARNVQAPVIPRRVQRYLLLTILVTALTVGVFLRCIKPGWDERRMFDRVFEAAYMAKENGAAAWAPQVTYGTNMEIEFADMIQLKSLAKHHLPHSGHHENRLVIVGDIHGCRKELLKLLDKVDFDHKRDHLIATGDMINKGPDSHGVVKVLRDLGASCVRGNHEDLVLLAWRDIHSKHSPIANTDEEDQFERERYSKKEYRARKTARELDGKQIKWLQDCPVILNVGRVEGMGEVNVVHAGLVPGVKLKRQDPFQVMNMRTMDPETRVPSENRDAAMHWDKVWSQWQKRLPQEERGTVVYGHDSKRGLNIQRWVKGLDSGCVNGDRLTALVIKAGGEQEVVSVKCSDKNRSD